MLQLQITDTDITNGNLAVAWCVDPETLKELSDANVVDPQVVIVVAPVDNYHRSREYRKVVPLKDLMTYLEVRSVGKNRIWAFVSLKSKKEARGYYLTRSSDGYSTDVLYDGQSWSYIFGYDDNRHPKHHAEPLEVNVPDGIFAKEPPAWEKEWVNHWFRTKAVDQCDFRRRRLLAYTVQPLFMIFDVLVVRTLMLLISTLWLSRGMSLKYHLHPLTYSVNDATDMLEGGSWAVALLPEDYKYNGPSFTVSYLLRKFWKVPLLPIVLLPAWAILHFHLVVVVSISLAIVAAIGLLMFTIFSGRLIKGFLFMVDWFDNLGTPDKPWYLDKDEMEIITCSPAMQKRTSIKALPAKHRTINLRFQDLKSKVCRPFSI